MICSATHTTIGLFPYPSEDTSLCISNAFQCKVVAYAQLLSAQNDISGSNTPLLP